MAPIRFLVLVLASLLVSGCFGGVFVAKASSPLVLTSYAYDGGMGRELQGTLNVTLYEKQNRGTIEANYRDQSDAFRITWTNFTGGEDYKSGGVATDLELFGDSGNGPPTLPRIRVYAAAWGSVEFFVDGTRQPDPTNLFQTMDATFFVNQGVYRDNETRRIRAASGMGPYDPARPHDSNVSAIGAMAVILVFTKRGDLFRLIEFSDVEIVAS